MKDLISVIIPVYNVEKYLNKCIESVVNQTYTNLEIILVDDGSTDNSGKICDEYEKVDKRIKVIHKENGGLSDARNSGINIAKGNYITFIDSDDYVELDYVKILYSVIIKDNSDMSIASHKVLYENGTIINHATDEENILNPEIVLERILYHDKIDLSAWSKLYRITLFKDIRYPKGRLFEDAATTYKLIDRSKKISVISKAIYNYIIRAESITTKEFNTKKMDLILSTEEMCNYIKEKYPKLENAANRRIMYAYLSTLSQLAMSSSDFPKERKQMIDYVKKHSKNILKDKKVPKRDKLAIISLKFGFAFYRLIWNIYRKASGRK